MKCVLPNNAIQCVFNSPYANTFGGSYWNTPLPEFFILKIYPTTEYTFSNYYNIRHSISNVIKSNAKDTFTPCISPKAPILRTETQHASVKKSYIGVCPNYIQFMWANIVKKLFAVGITSLRFCCSNCVYFWLLCKNRHENKFKFSKKFFSNILKWLF